LPRDLHNCLGNCKNAGIAEFPLDTYLARHKKSGHNISDQKRDQISDSKTAPQKVWIWIWIKKRQKGKKHMNINVIYN
jgi:hypothetical protein